MHRLLRKALRALGREAKRTVSAYWREHPRGQAHFFLESERFCRWLSMHIDKGEVEAAAILARATEQTLLASDIAQGINGQAINIDGGAVMF